MSMRRRALRAFFTFFVAASPGDFPAQANDKSDSLTDKIVQCLDLASFPNSSGPRRNEGLRTPRDYGLTISDWDHGELILLTARRDRMMKFKLLDSSKGRALPCVTDKALNGGTDFSVDPVEVHAGADGLYRWTGRKITNSECIPFPGEG